MIPIHNGDGDESKGSKGPSLADLDADFAAFQAKKRKKEL